MQVGKLEKVVLAVLFLASVGARTWLACAALLPAAMETYPDELRYYELAASLWQSGDILLYNAPTDFQKIACSLLLAPVFSLVDAEARWVAIYAVNAVLLSCGVFPVHWLSARLLRSGLLRMSVCVFYLAGAHMMYGLLPLSESLWIPLSLSLSAVFFKLLQQEDQEHGSGWRWGAAGGCLCYLCYLTKEIALIFPLGYIMYLALACLGRHLGLLAFRRLPWQPLLAFALAFALPFVLCKLTVFAGLGNSYRQMGWEVLLADGRAFYLLRGTICFLLNFWLAAGAVPILLPLLGCLQLDKDGRRLLAFLCCLLLVTAGTIAYTITIREDFPSLMPRAHIRYVAWLPVLFLLLFAQLAERLPGGRGFNFSRWELVALLAFLPCLGLLCLPYHGFTVGSSIDNTMWLWQAAMDMLPPRLFLAASGLLALAAWLWLNWRPRLVWALVFVLLLGCQAADGTLALQVHVQERLLSEEEGRSLQELSDFVSTHEESSFIVLDELGTKQSKALDTYLYQPNVRHVSATLSQQVKEFAWQRYRIRDPQEIRRIAREAYHMELGLFDEEESLRELRLSEERLPIMFTTVLDAYPAAPVDYVITRAPWSVAEDGNCHRQGQAYAFGYTVYAIDDSALPVRLCQDVRKGM